MTSRPTKLLSFEVKQNSRLLGKNLKFLTLDKFKVKLISHQKFGRRNTLPESNTIFEQNDFLVFSGMEDDLVIFEKFPIMKIARNRNRNVGAGTVKI